LWEAIASNRRRSALLLGGLGALLVLTGAAIGLFMDPSGGAAVGALLALAFFLVLSTVAVAGGDRLLLAFSEAREIEKEDAPRLWNVVEEMAIASGLGSPPRVFVVDQEAPNAFAVGSKRSRSAIAVTTGLLKRLDRDELQGVVGHEIAHIVNEDVRFMTIAAVLLGGVSLLADFFFRYLWWGGGRRRAGLRMAPQVQAAVVLGALFLAAIAPLAARLLYFACSRRREFLADACSARFTRYPEGLARALEKIAAGAPGGAPPVRAVAALCTVNPASGGTGDSLFSTHPPTEVRIRILRAMAGGASYADYEAAYRRVKGSGERHLSRWLSARAERVPVREASGAEGPDQDPIARAEEVAALSGRLANLISIGCPCGLRIRIPREFGADRVRCPRCGRFHAIPSAEPVAAGASSLRYARRGDGWESFRCACGAVHQLSPAFGAPFLACRSCRRRIEIVPASDGRSTSARL